MMITEEVNLEETFSLDNSKEHSNCGSFSMLSFEKSSSSIEKQIRTFQPMANKKSDFFNFCNQCTSISNFNFEEKNYPIGKYSKNVENYEFFC